MHATPGLPTVQLPSKEQSCLRSWDLEASLCQKQKQFLMTMMVVALGLLTMQLLFGEHLSLRTKGHRVVRGLCQHLFRRNAPLGLQTTPTTAPTWRTPTTECRQMV